MFEQGLPVSYYKEISELNKEHGVFIVRHRETGKICVKKILSVYNPAVYAVLFEHPVSHIPRIYALHEEDSRLTVIEEYISGDSLSDVLEIYGPFSAADAAACGWMLCGILSDLHAFKPPIIHRDIKPSNVILTEDGSVVLLDMNASRLQDPSKAVDTKLLGTPGFAAPEQYGFGSSSVETDIYAVGALMDALLPEAASARSSRLAEIINKCRELNPTQRYSSAAELARDLAGYLKGTNAARIHRPSDNSVTHSGKFFSHLSGGNTEYRIGIRLKNCPVCGRRQPVQYKICPECGQHFETAEREIKIPEASLGKSGKRRALAIAAGSAMILLGILFITQGAARRGQQETVPGTAISAAATAEETFSAETKPAETTPAETTPVEITPTETAPAEIPPEELFGSYKGETGSGLTIYPDGTAVYYHEIESYSEPDDPWTYSGGKISIVLSKLHCTITADVSEGGFSELVFASESENWDDERFRKLPSENEEYRNSALRSHDKAVTVLPDGRMEASFNGLTFTVPKQFVVFENGYNDDPNTLLLVDVDPEKIHLSNLCFQYADFEEVERLSIGITFPGFAKNFLYNFYYNVGLTDIKEETIAGIRTFTARFTGETNQGFRGVTGVSSEGIIAFFCNDKEKKVLRVILSKSTESQIDNMPELEQILYGARKTYSSAEWQ